MKIISNRLATKLFTGASARRGALAALAAAVTVAGVPGVAEAKWDRTRLQCSLDGLTDYSFSVRYETRVRVKGSPKASRTKFSVEFEAATGIGFAANDMLDVSIDTATGSPTVWGTIKLVTALNGDLVGEINYSSQAPSQQNGSKRPLPANFPKLAPGDAVEIFKGGTSQGACTLN